LQDVKKLNVLEWTIQTCDYIIERMLSKMEVFGSPKIAPSVALN